MVTAGHYVHSWSVCGAGVAHGGQTVEVRSGRVLLSGMVVVVSQRILLTRPAIVLVGMAVVEESGGCHLID